MTISFWKATSVALATSLALSACEGGSPGTTPVTSGPSNAALQSVGMQQLALPEAGVSSAKVKTSRIYVADFVGNGNVGDVDVYHGDGTPLTSLTAFMANPQNIVVDKHGNLFIANFGNDTVESFNTNFKVTNKGFLLPDRPVGLAVGPTGKLFATLYTSGTVVAYDQSGSQTTPTITGPGSVTYVAVDSAGKIYVTNSASNTLKTYKPNGTRTTPTITAGLNGPGDVFVDSSGKIYVANGGGSGSITTYDPSGKQTTPTIAVDAPHGLSVSGNGNIYVTDSANNTALTFNAHGKPISPTLTGFGAATGIAVLDGP